MRKALLVTVLVLLMIPALVKWRYGGGEPFPSAEYSPVMDVAALEVVADLPMPPGNIAVSAEGRVFFTFHPEARPEVSVAEWVNGQAVPWPSTAFQTGENEPLAFQNVLSVRIDRQGRLWALDNAHHGTGQPRLLAFDLDSGDVVHRYDFSSAEAPMLSHLNDFQVSNDGRYIFIADASIFGKKPALLLYDVQQQQARRLLENHVSVVAEKYIPEVQGREMEVFGIFAIRPGVDSITLSRDNQWLYFAAVTATAMYRAKVEDLINPTLSAEALAAKVERWASKSESDGITSDDAGNVYLTDPGHSAIHRMKSGSGELETLLMSPTIRWPDGMSFGPDGWLYFTCSSLHHVIGRGPAHIRRHAPYEIFRFKPGVSAAPGH